MLHCRYPIRKPREKCWGDGSPGVISYGEKEPDETFDVYCLADKMSGKPIFWYLFTVALIMLGITGGWGLLHEGHSNLSRQSSAAESIGSSSYKCRIRNVNKDVDLTCWTEVRPSLSLSLS